MPCALTESSLPTFAAEFLLQLLEPGVQIGTTLSRTAIALSIGGNRISRHPFLWLNFFRSATQFTDRFSALRPDPHRGPSLGLPARIAELADIQAGGAGLAIEFVLLR